MADNEAYWQRIGKRQDNTTAQAREASPVTVQVPRTGEQVILERSFQPTSTNLAEPQLSQIEVSLVADAAYARGNTAVWILGLLFVLVYRYAVQRLRAWFEVLTVALFLVLEVALELTSPQLAEQFLAASLVGLGLVALLPVAGRGWRRARQLFVATLFLSCVTAAHCTGQQAPLEIHAYRLGNAEAQRILVPLPEYRQLAHPPVVPSPTPSVAPTGPDHCRRMRASIRVADDRATVAMVMDLDLGGKNARTVPLLSDCGDMALNRFKGPGEPLTEPANLSLVTTATVPGHVELEYVVQVTRVGAGYRLRVPLPRTVEQVVDITLASQSEQLVTLENAVMVKTTTERGTTKIQAAGSGEPFLTASWEPRTQVKTAPEVGAPADQEFEPELSVSAATLASVTETHVRLRSNISIQVRNNPLKQLVLAAGPTVSFVDITGPEVAEWESVTEKNVQVAKVTLKSAAQDHVDLQVESELPAIDPHQASRAAASQGRLSFIPVYVPEAYHEEQSLGISAPPNLDLTVSPGADWREMDQARIPPALAALTGQSLVRLWHLERFPRSGRSEAPAPMDIEFRRLEDVQLLQATIDLMDATTVMTEDGHLLGRVLYRVRNNSQQFLTLVPPSDSQPLTAYVAGKAVRAASNTAGRWLVPLGKSGRISSGAAPFDVEITYLGAAARPLAVGNRMSLSLPKVDLGVSTVRWKVALPKDWSLTTTRGNMRSEATYRPVVFTSEEATPAASSPAALFDETTLPLTIELPKAAEEFHFSQDLLGKDAEARQVDITLAKSAPALTRRAGAFLVGVLFFYIVLRRRPEGRARVVATLTSLAGTGLLMAISGWASVTLGLWFHLALGLFMGTVIFGLSRMAVAGVAAGRDLPEP
jgi:hypothetical protein